jgi:uncharacterized protein YkwD
MLRICLTLIVSALCAALFRAPAASAAGLSDDHTVLYYLIEMQRRVTKTCGGRAMPEAPSLMPSEALRVEARKSAGGVLSRERTEAASSGAPTVYLTGRGKTPRQVFESLATERCPALMGPDYRYIGAAGKNGIWTVILSGAPEPSPPPAGAPETLPVAAASPASHEDAQSGVRTAGSDTVAAASPAPREDGERRAGENAYGPSRAAIRPEERDPAAPVPVGRISTDTLGRPVGSVKFYSDAQAAPSSVPAQAPSAPYAEPGGAGEETFVPPAEPGPFGARVPSGGAPSGPVRPGVIPLKDTRPQPAEDPLVYVAPGHAPSGQDADTSQTAAVAEVRVRAGGVRPEAARLLGLVNRARTEGRRCGESSVPPAPPLAENAVIAAAAEKHAATMTKGRFFSSTTPEGVTLGRRLTAAGYAWSFTAEDIAHMDGTAEDVLNGWLAVENRCLNLMGAEYTEAGAGYDPAGRNWVFTLAAPAR